MKHHIFRLNLPIFQVKHHIIHRLKPDGSAQVLLENFMKLPVAEELCQKKGSTAEEWKLVPYYEWFFKLAELLNKHLLRMWNDGLIYGFCGKDEAEHMLASCPQPTLLVRFSDIEFGKVKVSVKDRTGGEFKFQILFLVFRRRRRKRRLVFWKNREENPNVQPFRGKNLNIEPAQLKDKKENSNFDPFQPSLLFLRFVFSKNTVKNPNDEPFQPSGMMLRLGFSKNKEETLTSNLFNPDSCF